MRRNGTGVWTERCVDEELSELLSSIYSKNWLHATKTSLGEYLTEDDIPPLVRLDKLPGDYQIEPDEMRDTLYDADRDGIVTSSDCAKSLLNSLSFHSKLAEAFRQEYSKVMG